MPDSKTGADTTIGADKTSGILAAGFTARHRYARITARKARFVADAIRGRSANEAVEMLQFSPRRAAHYYLKVLRSAMANASHDEEVNLNRLVVADCRADDGPMLNDRMRWRAGPQGRAMPFAKKTSHLTVTVAEPLDEPRVERRRARQVESKKTEPVSEKTEPVSEKEG